MRVYYKCSIRMSLGEAKAIVHNLEGAMVLHAHDPRMGADYVSVKANLTAYDAERLLMTTALGPNIAFVADP